VKIQSEADIHAVAAYCHGFGLRDLVGLCDSTSIEAVKDQHKYIRSGQDNCTVFNDVHFRKAYEFLSSNMKTRGTAQFITTQIAEATFSDVGGLDHVKVKLLS
jgi:SpoVK/Ycf46/Vps4 family AAA+-type ATPase